MIYIIIMVDEFGKVIIFGGIYNGFRVYFEEVIVFIFFSFVFFFFKLVRDWRSVFFTYFIIILLVVIGFKVNNF